MKSKTVILISGKQGSGKTTLTKGLVEALSPRYTVRVLKFADIIYQMHDAVCQIAQQYGISTLAKEGTLLQLLGTEWGRKTKGENIWADAAKNKALAVNEDLIIIDDCRFPNEFDTFPDAIKIRLDAPLEARKERADSWRENSEHISETALDQYAKEMKFNLYCKTVDGPAHTLNFVLNALNKRGI